MEPSERDHIELRLPASSQYLHVARLVAAGVAGRLGFDYDEIEDLRIAVDEMCFLLLRAQERQGELRLELIPNGESLVIEGCGTFSEDGAIPPPPIELGEEATGLSQHIASALVDHFDLVDDRAEPRARLVKRRSALQG